MSFVEIIFPIINIDSVEYYFKNSQVLPLAFTIILESVQSFPEGSHFEGLFGIAYMH